MDKETLRIIIIATGLIIVIAMLTWGYLKDKKSQRDMDFDDDREIQKSRNDAVDINDEEEEYIEDLGSAIVNSPEDYYTTDEDDEGDDDTPLQPRIATPEIIQFCLAARVAEGFNGLDLINAFRIAGLKYGSLKIFERIDNNQLVDFGVASMTETGTFPASNLENFYCPGVVFFMQPNALDDAVAVFDDYVETIRMLSIELEGDIWDHKRQPLTDATIRAIRQSL
jgi:cell division protein ZipA